MTSWHHLNRNLLSSNRRRIQHIPSTEARATFVSLSKNLWTPDRENLRMILLRARNRSWLCRLTRSSLLTRSRNNQSQHRRQTRYKRSLRKLADKDLVNLMRNLVWVQTNKITKLHEASLSLKTKAHPAPTRSVAPKLTKSLSLFALKVKR